MTRLRQVYSALLLLVVGLQGCGNNPLLRTASADYEPIRVGSQWTYTSPSGGPGLTRQVTAAGLQQGRDAFTVSQTIGGVPSTEFWSLRSGALEIYSVSLGAWTLARRLPYVPGNKWDLATGSVLSSSIQTVEALESLDVPAGKFPGCYRLKTRTNTYNPGSGLTSTAETIVWSAPDVGDVRYASVDTSGTVNITLELSSYRIPR